MKFLLLNYMVWKRRPGSRRKRDIVTKYGKLHIKGVWSSDETHEKIKRTLRSKHPGWMIAGFCLRPGPTPRLDRAIAGKAGAP